MIDGDFSGGDHESHRDLRFAATDNFVAVNGHEIVEHGQ
jgi:hypothetical protein